MANADNGIGGIFKFITATLSKKKETKPDARPTQGSVMRLMKIDVESVIKLITDRDCRAAYTALAERFMYSDPISSPELSELEGKMTALIANAKLIAAEPESTGFIKSEINNGDYEVPKTKKEKLLEIHIELSALLTERNELCKSLK